MVTVKFHCFEMMGSVWAKNVALLRALSLSLTLSLALNYSEDIFVIQTKVREENISDFIL